YSDVPTGLWHSDAIEAVSRKGLFKGYPDGTFRPNQPITRAELASVIFYALNLTEQPPIGTEYSDVEGTHWAASKIDEITRHRIINGYLDGTFRPDQDITRAEAVKMINRLLHRGPLYGVQLEFAD